MTETIQATAQSLRQLKDVPASMRIAGFLLLKTKSGRLSFGLTDGRTIVFDQGNPGPQAHVEIHDYRFIQRALAGGDVGFAEAYMDGDWSTPDLTSVLEFFSANFEAAGRLAVGGWIVRWKNLIRHLFNRNSKQGAQRNIMAHYDLGNDFYREWLDPSMTYSSALFDNPNMSLEQGQHAKYTAICDQIDAREGSNILEIGCGWGGFAEHAAKYRGANVTCLTISPSQRDWALERIYREGLGEKVDIRLEDSRDHDGTYDGVASIEMFEAVGEAYWARYFAKVAEALKAGGKAALQIITIGDDLFPRYRKRADFIQRYIFPGGMMPSEAALKPQFEQAGLINKEVRYFGEDYARTLREWSRNFNEKWEHTIQPQGFDDVFRRMWNFYLSYCEAGFKNGRINVGHFALAKA